MQSRHAIKACNQGVGPSVSNGVAERSGRTSGRVERRPDGPSQPPGTRARQLRLTHPQALRSMVRGLGPGPLGAASCAGLGYDEPNSKPPKPNKGA